MPAIRRYTVTKTEKISVNAESPENAVAIATDEDNIPSDRWERTNIDASKDY